MIEFSSSMLELDLIVFSGFCAYATVSALPCVAAACAVCSSETEGVRDGNVLQAETEDPGGEIPGLCHS